MIGLLKMQEQELQKALNEAQKQKELLQVALVADQKIVRDDVKEGVVTISLGYTANKKDHNKMVNMADKALYVAKENGKNQAVCFESMFNNDKVIETALS